MSKRSALMLGEIIVENHKWFIAPAAEPGARIPVEQVDAWNFDVYAGLKVSVKRVRGKFRIVGRQNNKKYVKITQDNLSAHTTKSKVQLR